MSVNDRCDLESWGWTVLCVSPCFQFVLTLFLLLFLGSCEPCAFEFSVSSELLCCTTKDGASPSVKVIAAALSEVHISACQLPGFQLSRQTARACCNQNSSKVQKHERWNCSQRNGSWWFIEIFFFFFPSPSLRWKHLVD